MVISSLLPMRDHIALMKIARKTRRQLEFSKEDLVKIKYEVRPDGGSRFDRDALEPIEVEIDDLLRDYISKALDALEKKGLITDEHVEIWDMFVADNNPALE